MPRTYRWKQTSQVEESVCFRYYSAITYSAYQSRLKPFFFVPCRATIFHYPDNTCETITKCLPSTDIPTAGPIDNGNKITNEIVFELPNNETNKYKQVNNRLSPIYNRSSRSMKTTLQTVFVHCSATVSGTVKIQKPLGRLTSHTASAIQLLRNANCFR